MHPCSEHCLSGPSPTPIPHVGSWRWPEGQVVTPTTSPALRCLSRQECAGRVKELDTLSGGRSRFECPARRARPRVGKSPEQRQNALSTDSARCEEPDSEARGSSATWRESADPQRIGPGWSAAHCPPHSTSLRLPLLPAQASLSDPSCSAAAWVGNSHDQHVQTCSSG